MLVNAKRKGITLSQRQSEIVRLVIEGRVKAEIAQQLGISMNTVSSHLKMIYRILGRFGVKSKANLVEFISENPDLLSKNRITV